jgi:hypothetical protein
MDDGATGAVAGVRKPPKNEPAGYGALEARRALDPQHKLTAGTVEQDFFVS